MQQAISSLKRNEPDTVRIYDEKFEIVPNCIQKNIHEECKIRWGNSAFGKKHLEINFKIISRFIELWNNSLSCPFDRNRTKAKIRYCNVVINCRWFEHQNITQVKRTMSSVPFIQDPRVFVSDTGRFLFYHFQWMTWVTHDHRSSLKLLFTFFTIWSSSDFDSSLLYFKFYPWTILLGI